MKRIYLDYAATTPIDPIVLKAMMPYMKKKFANPSSLHSFGRQVNEDLENFRKIFADYLNVSPEEIIFTGSATESNNLALKGIAFANQSRGKHIIISPTEHDCVLNAASWLKKFGFEIDYVSVDKDGIIDLDNLKKLIRKDTILISIMHANNEIGTIEPIFEVGKICKENNIIFHTDTSQSFGKEKIDVKEMNIDLLTASSHKIYGPKGVALLYLKKGIKIDPLLHGGGHEGGRRSSTSNMAGIAGFAKATELCFENFNNENIRITKMRDKVIKELLKIPHTKLNGHSTQRLANNINISFEYIEGEAILMELDSNGIAVSTASACSSPKLTPSHVLKAIDLKPQLIHGTVRISLGRFTTNEEIDKLLEVLPNCVNKLRKMSPFGK